MNEPDVKAIGSKERKTGKPLWILAALPFAGLFLSCAISSLFGTKSSEGYLPGDAFQPWEGGPQAYSAWVNGPSDDPDFFPISVWLQNPANAQAYKDIGINQYIGLFAGPTEAQLATLAAHSMPAICAQNSVALGSANQGMVNGWSQPDEPDNAQPLSGGGYGPPILPSVLVADYESFKAADSTRPVFLNFGQGPGWDEWYGRGTRTNHPEDYPEYAAAGDILCFDIYPMNVNGAASGDLWRVGYGVGRLREWSGYQKPVWAWIECTQIESAVGRRPTPVEVKAEIWSALVNGARGYGFFAHVIDPFDEIGLLNDEEMSAAVALINSEVMSLAPALNSQSLSNGATVESSNAAVPVEYMVKRSGGYSYLFAVVTRPGTTTADFALRGFSGPGRVEVLGEGRSIESVDGAFTDAFSEYAVHLYRIETPLP